MINMKNVVKMFDETQVMGTVKGLTFYNKNGATKTFMNEWMMKNYLNSYGLTIKQSILSINLKKLINLIKNGI